MARPAIGSRTSPADQFRLRTIRRRLHPDIRPVCDQSFRLQMTATSCPAAVPSFPAVRLLGSRAKETSRYLIR